MDVGCYPLQTYGPSLCKSGLRDNTQTDIAAHHLHRSPVVSADIRIERDTAWYSVIPWTWLNPLGLIMCISLQKSPAALIAILTSPLDLVSHHAADRVMDALCWHVDMPKDFLNLDNHLSQVCIVEKVGHRISGIKETFISCF
jgi:hypothetical protein